mmetsp:Transcript_91345/g.246927  ORF Transcript_91345/g.246927 Transcript_91345/m.246927 type:complete len:260 (+) Transcript_91345:325-1104(+)
MVHLEWLGKRRHHLLLAHRHACERHLAALHLRHAHEDVRVGPVGDARLHLHDSARRPAPRPGALRHRLFAPQVVLVRGGLDCVLLHRRCAKCLRLCLVDDHPRQQVVRPQGLLPRHLPDGPLLRGLALCRPRDRLEALQRNALRARDLGQGRRPSRLLGRGHLLGRGAARVPELPLPAADAEVLQRRHSDLPGPRLPAPGWLSHRQLREHRPRLDFAAEAHAPGRRQLRAPRQGDGRRPRRGRRGRADRCRGGVCCRRL